MSTIFIENSAVQQPNAEQSAWGTITIFSVKGKMTLSIFFRIIPTSVVFFALASPLFSLDYLVFREGSRERKEQGRILLEAQNGLVFEARDGQYFIVPPEDVIDRQSDDTPFQTFSRKELLERLKKEFPESRGYSILQKEHFLIVYTTSKAFADWYGRLLEKLYSSYIAFWKGKGLALDKLETPMVALIYSNRDGFFRHAKSEGVTPHPQLCAYYNKLTNRVVLCDISGLEKMREGSDDRANARAIQNFLRQPSAAYNIALVVHEATHLIGFNCGMHRRFAPYPLWVCEGLAMFHEVPDRNDKNGWNIRPRPNDVRLRDLKNYLSQRPYQPLQKMIRDDKVFHEPATALNNYAMAWGLTYYLVMRRPKDFSEYLKRLMEKRPETEDSPEIRIREFEDCFGDDWDKLYRECGDYLRKL